MIIWDLFQECRDDSISGYPLISGCILVCKESHIYIDAESLSTHDKNIYTQPFSQIGITGYFLKMIKYLYQY